MQIIIAALAALALILVIGAVARRMLASAAPTWRLRLWDGVHGSATIAVARLGVVASAGLEVAAQLADLSGVPGMREAIQGVVPAEYWPAVMLTLMVATEVARRRTL